MASRSPLRPEPNEAERPPAGAVVTPDRRANGGRRRRLAESRVLRSLARALPHGLERRLADGLLGRPSPRWGNLRRLTPISADWGFDRGRPVDLFHVHRFLERHSADVRGAVLEVKDSAYTDRFGGQAVTGRDVLDIDAANDLATIVGDLSELGSLPSERFDCFILTETLQLVPDLYAAVQNAWRSLAPGGVLLITVPTLSRIDPQSRDVDSWRLTPTGLGRVVARSCPGAEVQIEGYGNVLMAIAFLLGLATKDLREEELLASDPDFPIGTCARVAKPRPGGPPA